MNDQHCLIVGGTRGLGREIANLFAQQGRRISVFGRRAPNADEANSANISHWTLDVTDTPAVTTALQEAVKKNGPINYLVFLQRYRGEGDKWDGEISTSVTATQRLIELAVPQFTTTGDRSVVLVSSIADTFISASQPVGYHVAKAALVQMTYYYAVVLGPKGIRVNCVSPCTMVKDENSNFYMKNDQPRKLFETVIPLGRMGTSKDAAQAVNFFCRPESSFITGQKITVDGGVSLLSQEALARQVTGL